MKREADINQLMPYKQIMKVQKSAMNELFKDKSDILGLIQRADNKEETLKLTSYFQNLQKDRHPFYLTIDELAKILKWKLRSQHGRQLKRREENINENVIIITKAAFAITHQDEDTEISLKLKLLTSLSGVAVAVASAILTLCYPKQYSVIDFRNWHQIMGEKRRTTTFTINEYTDYLKIIRCLAKEFDVTPQQVDIAIWQKDIEQNK